MNERTMMRHRVSSELPARNNSTVDDESSDDDDAFTALSRKRKGEPKSKDTASKKPPSSVVLPVAESVDATTTSISATSFQLQLDHKINSSKEQPVVVAQTSSTKRHHGDASGTRKAKMDAILLELEAETIKKSSLEPKPQQQQQSQYRNSRRNNSDAQYRNNNDSEPQQHRSGGGSFVDPGDEHITTNLFIGNLATNITEEQMTELFRQFGDLYSVKIMWPRTPEERIRNRHTGFVCFMNRQDAEDAMDACNEQDPFRVGRQLMMRWGKNVRKRDDGGVPMMYRGTGGTLPFPIAIADVNNQNVALTLRSVLNPVDHCTIIQVVVPKDKDRVRLISTVASFVAKDGEQFEQLLLQHDGQNPHLKFLSMPTTAITDTNYNVAREEYIYYKWRVFAFCQGDGFSTWRQEPFSMYQPNGCIWYPPALDIDAAQKETEEVKRKEDAIRALKDERRYQNTKRNVTTGRQLEQLRKKGIDGTGTELSESDHIQYDKLFIQQLCLSRESICQAMAFCFEKSIAATEISLKIRDLILQLTPGISLETLSARIYLISDILYNTQQPGIRNAFLYRDAIEKMAPNVFSYLGDFVRTNLGRLSQERVASTVTSVLLAWSNWGVFDPTFINDLSAKFEGRTTIDPAIVNVAVPEEVVPVEQHIDNQITETPIIDEKPKGDWTSISVRDELAATDMFNKHSENEATVCDVIRLGEDDNPDGTPLDNDDPDGEPLDDDNPDGEPLDDDDNPDGKPLDNDDPDGEPLDDDDPDGEPLDDDDNPDGEPLDDDDNPDGEPLDAGNNQDGKPLDDDDNP